MIERWHAVGPRADKIIMAAIIIYVVPLFAYAVANVVLWPFINAATAQYRDVIFQPWLRIPCDRYWAGYRVSYRDGMDRAHVMFCLTANGWVVIQTENDKSTPSRP